MNPSPRNPMHIVIVSDAWYPQVNGVVRTLDMVRQHLEQFGHRVTMITPQQFRTIPCPTYPEIRLAWDVWNVSQQLHTLQPDCIHIATEGPLGYATRRYCQKHGLGFTTSYHTKFPEYIARRFHIPVNWTYRILRWFHAPSKALFVATPSLKRELASYGFSNLTPWTRGVDTELFHPDKRDDSSPYPRPIWLYVGRIAVEKNLEAFLNLKMEGTKLLVGDGPDRKKLEVAYSDAVFAGAIFGKALAQHYANADVFVFPSKTDTFGLVMLEALACGTPVAAYPVTGPIDVITDEKAGILHDDLKQAAEKALTLNREDCRHYALNYSWENCARIFEQHLYKNNRAGYLVKNPITSRPRPSAASEA